MHFQVKMVWFVKLINQPIDFNKNIQIDITHIFEHLIKRTIYNIPNLLDEVAPSKRLL